MHVGDVSQNDISRRLLGLFVASIAAPCCSNCRILMQSDGGGRVRDNWRGWIGDDTAEKKKTKGAGDIKKCKLDWVL